MNTKPKISSFKSSERWLKSAPNYGQPDVKVDNATGLLSDVAICTAGPALGHGVNLDQEFIETIVNQGNALSQGAKCRFGHPTMSGEALGTYLGRFMNFRVIENKAIADLHLDEVCKKAPGGNLFDYVVEMAAKNPDMFGASIVFYPGATYQRSESGEKVIVDRYSEDGSLIKKFEEEPVFIECEELKGADVVDQPAANEGGLFSSAQFNSGAFSVRISQFLDQNPDIWSFVEKHPEKFKPFLEKYAAYQQKKTHSMSKKIAVVGRKSNSFFSSLAAALTGQKTFATTEATTTDGNNIRIVMQGDEPAVDDEIYVVAEDGSESPAPDGDHTVAGGDMDGYVFSVADGKITAIVTPDAIDAPGNPPVAAQQSAKPTANEAKLKAENEELRKQLSDKEAEFAAFKKKPLAKHTGFVPSEDGANGDVDPDAQFREKPWNKNKKPIKRKA